MKRLSRDFSVTRACVLGASLVTASLLIPQAGWAQAEAEAPPKKPGNLIFFRGGYTQLLDSREFESFTDTHDTLGLGSTLGISPNDNNGGWYVGAAFDFLLTRDIWGMAPGIWALAELGLEFKKYESNTTTLVVPTFEKAAQTAFLRGGADEPLTAGDVSSSIITGRDQISMLTITASPKFKFMEGSRFRPWVIPAGLDITVISPPSDAATVLDVGAVFAAGAEYEITPGIKLGIDGRYHLLGDMTDPNISVSGPFSAGALPINQNLNNDNWTVGGYLGIGF